VKWAVDRPKICAGIQLLFLVGLLLDGIRDNSYINDEAARIGAGFSYLNERNMRLNPEDPPLGKDLAALPLMSLGLRAPRPLSELRPGNVGYGDSFPYGVDLILNQEVKPQRILFLARLSTVLFSLALGALLFTWGAALWGPWAGNLALFFYAFSPNILAHSSFVTLDIAAGLGAMLTLWTLVRLLEAPSRRNLAVAAGAAALAINLKFNLLPILPYIGIVMGVWAWRRGESPIPWAKRYAVILGACLALLLPIYEFHFMGYPREQFFAEITALTSEWHRPWLAPHLIALGSYSVLDAFVQMFIGIAYRVVNMTSFSYLNGEGFYGAKSYFYPQAYLLKEPLGFHLLTLIGVVAFVKATPRFWRHCPPPVAIILGWMLLYGSAPILAWDIADGLRHLMPIYPFIFLLAAGLVAQWIRAPSRFPRARAAIGAGLLLWQTGSVLAHHPFHLSYMNELARLTGHERKLFALSSYELGEQAKRLADWATEMGIDRVKVPWRFNFFAAENPAGLTEGSWFYRSYEFYLGNRFDPYYKVMPADVPAKGWIAIPGTLYNWGTAFPARDRGWGSDTFRWMEGMSPVAVVGGSILVYHVE
jgi:hypothetical protein